MDTKEMYHLCYRFQRGHQIPLEVIPLIDAEIFNAAAESYANRNTKLDGWLIRWHKIAFRIYRNRVYWRRSR